MFNTGLYTLLPTLIGRLNYIAATTMEKNSHLFRLHVLLISALRDSLRRFPTFFAIIHTLELF